jgi:hypothetical protein
MSTLTKLRAAAVVGGLGLFAACSEGTAPPTASRFDGQRVESGAAAVERVATSSALSGLQLLTRFGVDGAVSSVTSSQGAPGLEAAVQRIVTSATSTGTYLIPLMRPSVLGKTFVFDPVLKRYVPDPTRTGAPANGVRFILYAETASGDPIVGREIGYADLTDEKRSSPSVAGVKLVVVTDGITRLNYSVDVTSLALPTSFVVQGFIIDGDDRLDFSVAASSAILGGDEYTVDATFTAPKQGFEVKAKVTAKRGQPEGDGTIDLTITSASDKVVVDAVTVNGKLDATFTVNGQLLARATGDPKHPDIRGEGGRALTPEELRAVAKIVEMSDAIFDLLHDLSEPAWKLLLIAITLGE